MAIVKKSELQRHLDELERRFQELKKAVIGVEPNENIFVEYCNDPEYYKKHFTEVDVTSVNYALHDFRGVLKQLENIKKLQAPRRSRAGK